MNMKTIRFWWRFFLNEEIQSIGRTAAALGVKWAMSTGWTDVTLPAGDVNAFIELAVSASPALVLKAGAVTLDRGDDGLPAFPAGRWT